MFDALILPPRKLRGWFGSTKGDRNPDRVSRGMHGAGQTRGRNVFDVYGFLICWIPFKILVANASESSGLKKIECVLMQWRIAVWFYLILHIKTLITA